MDLALAYSLKKRGLKVKKPVSDEAVVSSEETPTPRTLPISGSIIERLLGGNKKEEHPLDIEEDLPEISDDEVFEEEEFLEEPAEEEIGDPKEPGRPQLLHRLMSR